MLKRIVERILPSLDNVEGTVDRIPIQAPRAYALCIHEMKVSISRFFDRTSILVLMRYVFVR